MTAPTRLATHLWFTEGAHAAAAFYVSLFPDSRVDRADTIAGRDGPIETVAFTLAGQAYLAFASPGGDAFNHAISLTATCADQAEVDRLWNALSAGGAVEQCGWLKDRFGVSWQITPAVLPALLADPDPARAARAMQAMMGMVKLDIAALEAAAAG